MLEIFWLLQNIGIFWILCKLYCILQELIIVLKSDASIQKKYGKGCWAVVTGSTDGIGKGFCQQLAKQNVNICMIARNRQKAEDVIQEMKNQGSKSEFKIIIADFAKSHSDLNLFKNIYEQVQNLDIGLLVNNVGVAHMDRFNCMTEEQIRDMIIVNCYPVTLLTRALINMMLKRNVRSGIVNVSSVAGVHPTPYDQVYSATKAFDDYFSRSITGEFQNKIDLISLRPFYVSTPMTHYIKGHGSIQAEDCAYGCLQRIGLTDATYGHWFHRIQGTLVEMIPTKIRYFMFKKYAEMELQQQESVVRKKKTN